MRRLITTLALQMLGPRCSIRAEYLARHTISRVAESTSFGRYIRAPSALPNFYLFGGAWRVLSNDNSMPVKRPDIRGACGCRINILQIRPVLDISPAMQERVTLICVQKDIGRDTRKPANRDCSAQFEGSPTSYRNLARECNGI